MMKDGTTLADGVDEAVLKNIGATKQLARIVQTSLGPNGMKKLIINHLGKTLVSSDCATIARELEVVHPAVLGGRVKRGPTFLRLSCWLRSIAWGAQDLQEHRPRCLSPRLVARLRPVLPCRHESQASPASSMT